MTKASEATSTGPIRPARHYQPLVVIAAAVSVGIAIDRYSPTFGFAVSYSVWWALAAVCGAAWIALHFTQRNRTAALVLLVACAAAGAVRHHAQWYLFPDDDLGWFADVEPRAVALEATVVEAPRSVAVSSSTRAVGSVVKTRFKIRAFKVREADIWHTASGVADVQVDGQVVGVVAGDRVELFGKLVRPSPPLNPGEFDFAAHYRADRKLCVVRLASPEGVRVLEPSSGWNVAARLSTLRGAAHAWLLQSIPADQVGFASALLLGYRDMLDRRDNAAFFRTGTVHILILSLLGCYDKKYGKQGIHAKSLQLPTVLLGSTISGR